MTAALEAKLEFTGATGAVDGGEAKLLGALGLGCEKGEERCPLGHCQKPGVVFVEVWPKSGQSPYHLEEYVCSVCRVVYVPLATKEKG